MIDNLRNSRISFHINFFWNFLVINSILTPYYLSLGFSFSDIASINGIFILVRSLTDYPMGVIADEIGSRQTLILAGLIKGVGGTLLLFSHSYFGVLSAFVAIGIANGFYSGADLKIYASGGKEQLVKSIMDKVFFVQMGTAASSIVGSTLIGLHGSFFAPMLANCALAWVPMFLALRLKDEKTSSERTAPRKFGFVDSARLFFYEVRANKRLRQFLNVRIFSFAIAFIQTQFYQSLLGHLNFPVVAFGWIAFAKAFLIGVTSLFAKSRVVDSSVLFKAALFLFPLFSICAGFLPPHMVVASIALTFFMDLSTGITGGVIAGKVSGLVSRSHVVAFESIVTTLSAIVAATGVKIIGISLDYLGFQKTYIIFLFIAIFLTTITARIWNLATKEETYGI